ncbi:MAG: PQQ-binding-like beta-propeller repeat protein [Bacteroidales bacterium]
MSKHRTRISIILTLLCCFTYNISAQSSTRQWPQFRGQFASGILNNTDLPERWDLETGENIKWKRYFPGLGHSCPIVWDDIIFLTTAISGSGDNSLKVGLYGDIDDVDDMSEHKFKLYCIEKNSGKLIWERLVHQGIPSTKRHTKASHANPTPATNGKYVVVSFGSEGLYCYDFHGNLVWKKAFGRMNAGPHDSPETEWGFASSPIIHEDRIIVQCDFLGDSFIACYDLETGKVIWERPRIENSTWSTPNFYSNGENRQIIVNGYNHMGGYNFDTGEEIWKMSGGGDAPTPTPIFAHNHFFIHNAHGRYSPIYAVRDNAVGDITLHNDSTSNEYITWSIKRGGAYMPTNLVIGDYLYNLRMNGLLLCFHAVTGEPVYAERLPDSRGITASGVASDGKIYYAFEQGEVYTIQAGPEFKILEKNNLGGLVMATPAITQDMLIFRTEHYLVGVGKTNEK